MAQPVPFVITYYTHDIDANRWFYGEVLGLDLHCHRGMEDTYFLCGTDTVRLQILDGQAGAGPPSAHGIGPADPPSTGVVMLGVDSASDLQSLRERAESRGVHPVHRDGEDPAHVVRLLDPDGRMVIAQVFNRSHPFDA